MMIYAQREKTMRSMQKNIDLKQKKMNKTKTRVKGDNRELKSLQKILNKAEKDATKMSNTKRNLESQRNKLLERKKAHWRRGDEVEREIKATTDSIKNAERSIFRCPRDINNALQHVQQLVKARNISGAHGPVFELFKVPNEKFRIAAEVTAHNSLYNYVVDTQRLASNFIKELENRNVGRLTFMPLDRLTKRNIVYPPQTKDENLVALVKRLEYDPKYEDVMMQVKPLILVVLAPHIVHNCLCSYEDLWQNFSLSRSQGCFESSQTLQNALHHACW